MTDLERIEDQYPELRFWSIEVPNPHFHASIVGKDVYVNELQPDIDKLRAMLHETVHYKYDSGDLSKVCTYKSMHAEGWAIRESGRLYRDFFCK